MKSRTIARIAAAAVASVAASAALTTQSANARAGGNYVETIASTSIICRTTTADNQYRVQARVYQDDRGSNHFHAQVFENSGNVELVSEAWGEPSWGPGSVNAKGELIDPGGEPLPGFAALAATYATGETSTRTVRMQQGNQRIVSEVATTELALSGVEVQVSDLELRALDCIGSRQHETLTYTTPAQFAEVTRTFKLSEEADCYLAGGEVSAQLDGRELSLLVRYVEGGIAELSGRLHFNGEQATGGLDAYDAEGAPAGMVDASVRLTQVGPTVSERIDEEEFFLARRRTLYALDLRLEFPGHVAAVTCQMEKITQRVLVQLPH